MGGQNHQPTNRRLAAASAWLSRAVCEGYGLVLRANNHLEDAIIIGMGGLHVSHLGPLPSDHPDEALEQAIGFLDASLDALDRIKEAYRNIVVAAGAERYVGNPLASTVSELKLLDTFNGTLIQPAIQKEVWLELERRIGESNILATLAWEADEFSELREPTEELIHALGECRDYCRCRGAAALVDALEANEIALRLPFARVLSRWSYLETMFLYSAMIMTELFYRANRLPGLLEQGPSVTISAA